jgi:predicted nuclease with RNAse H fold
MLCHAAAWVGVDVGGKRKGFDVAVIDERRVLALQSHLARPQVVDLAMKRPAVIATDSPCCCLPEGQITRDGELQLARSICGIGRTPGAKHVDASAYYAWILEGLALFQALGAHDVEVIEVSRLPHGLAGTASEAPGPARPDSARAGSPWAW